MLERRAELLDGLKPRIRIFFDRFQDDFFDALVDVRIIFGRRRWWRVNVVLHDLKFAIAFEGEMSRQHFIQRDSEFVDVGANVYVAILDLFGRHVGKRAQLRARARHAARAHYFRDTEVHHLNEAIFIQHQVAGLDVTMENSRAVRIPDAEQRLPEERNRFDFWDGAAAPDHLREGLAFHKFHHHYCRALMNHEGVESGEICMVEVGLRSCFCAESFDQLRVLR